jgi:hypothetical protein
MQKLWVFLGWLVLEKGEKGEAFKRINLPQEVSWLFAQNAVLRNV